MTTPNYSFVSNPKYGADYNAAKANLADQGMLSSTAAAGTLANAQAADAYNNQTLAQQWFNLLYSGALGRAGIAQSTKGVAFPSLPKGIGSIIQNAFTPSASQAAATSVASGTGDATTVNDLMVGGKAIASEPGMETINVPYAAAAQQKVVNSENQQKINLANAQFAWQQAQAQKTDALQAQEWADNASNPNSAAYKAANDPYTKMAAELNSDRIPTYDATGKNVIGYTQAHTPEQYVAMFNAAYKVNLPQEAAIGNPQAISLLKSMGAQNLIPSDSPYGTQPQSTTVSTPIAAPVSPVSDPSNSAFNPWAQPLIQNDLMDKWAVPTANEPNWQRIVNGVPVMADQAFNAGKLGVGALVNWLMGHS